MKNRKNLFLLFLSFCLLIGSFFFAYQTYILKGIKPFSLKKNNSNPRNIPENKEVSKANELVSEKDLDINKFLSQAPTKNSTPEDNKKFQELVKLYVKDVDILDISGCNPNPKIFKLNPEQKVFKIKNNDSVTHNITHSHGINIIVKPKSSESINFSLKDQGVYGYSCDEKSSENSKSVAGVLLYMQ